MLTDAMIAMLHEELTGEKWEGNPNYRLDLNAVKLLRLKYMTDVEKNKAFIDETFATDHLSFIENSLVKMCKVVRRISCEQTNCGECSGDACQNTGRITIYQVGGGE